MIRSPDAAIWNSLVLLTIRLSLRAPIKTHDLIYLVKKCELQLPEKHLDFIGRINTAAKRFACAIMSYQAGVSYESLWAQYAAQEEDLGTRIEIAG